MKQSEIKTELIDIQKGKKNDDENPISLSISRTLKTAICTKSLDLVIGIFRQDNATHGYCLGYLPYDATIWLNNFFNKKDVNPFAFEIEYHEPSTAKPK